jgi:hypothetical protein
MIRKKPVLGFDDGNRFSKKIMLHEIVIGVRQIMSETVDIQTKPKPVRDNSKEKRTLDQVEKWMEMIREINREPVEN